MMPIDTILHPTDFPATSEAALELACSLARVRAARLVILHVEPGDLTTGGIGPQLTDMIGDVKALGALRDRVVGPSPGFPVDTCVREGVPSEEILRAADDLGADFDRIARGAKALKALSRSAIWDVPTIFDADEYIVFTAEFQRLCDELAEKAKGRNLDGATLAYFRLTSSCVNCHKYVRSATK